MISVKKSLPGLGKNLKWLPEMAFQGFQISKFSGGACPQTPPETGVTGAPPAHKFLATAMYRLPRKVIKYGTHYTSKAT